MALQREDVEFVSLDAKLRGWLFHPEGNDQLNPAVILTHGFTATRTMTIDKYAEAFASAGFAALVYDHRGFGASDGEPRREISHFFQAQGYLDALTFLCERPEIDRRRVAVWGDSLSGNVSLLVAAVDERPAAVVAQVPGCGSELPPSDTDGSIFASYAAILSADDMLALPREVTERTAVVMPDPTRQACQFDEMTAWRWFMEHGCRLGSDWVNDMQRSAMPLKSPYNVAHCAPHVRVPTLFVVSYEDEIPNANPAIAKAVFDKIPAPKKQLHEIAGGHFGLLWHPSPLFDEAVSVQKKFLLKVL